MIKDCEHGWAPKYWKWTHKNGANTEEDYPYEDKMGECGRHVETRKMELGADDVEYIPYDPNVSMVHRMLDYLENGPIACTMDTTKDCWMLYKSGILDSEICGQSTVLNHYMTLVGFYHAPVEKVEG